LVEREDEMRDYYYGYRYWKSKGAASMDMTIGRRYRAKIRTNVRYQAMIRKAHAKHSAKVERVYKEELLAR